MRVGERSGRLEFLPFQAAPVALLGRIACSLGSAIPAAIELPVVKFNAG